jgi:Peptidase M66
MRAHQPLFRFSPSFLMAALLVACGGGGGSGSSTDAGGSTGTNPTPPTTPAQAQISRLQLAQTHVLPADGLSWAQPNGKRIELHLTAGRGALALVDAQPLDLAGAQLEGRVGGASLGTVALADNSALPPTEDGGERYSATARVAALPADWLQPGLELRLLATNASASAWQAVSVGAQTSLAIRTLPFYLFGTTEALASLNQASLPSAQALDELYAKWPIAQLSVSAHPAAKVSWPQLIIAPRNGGPAYVMNSFADRKDGFDPISAVHSATSAIRAANGEANTANQYYGAMVQADANGVYASAGGGLGGGHVGAGDLAYAGVFVHEQGHAFGMPHAGESNAAGTGYPYLGGSLNGSAWGFDQKRQRFMSTLVPTTASSYRNCAGGVFNGTPRQLDAQGRCIRQDPMQSGSGDQAAGDAYTLFSDYNAAVVQKYLEGVASLNAQGQLTWDGGRVHESAASVTGYRRWNSLAKSWVAVDPTVDADKGLYGVNAGYPVTRGVPVYTLVVTRSHAGTAGATQVYPPIGPYSGNLLRTFDPTSASDRAAMTPNTGPYPWYCHASGCDFTLRVSYANGAVRHVVVQGGFRPWFKPSDAPKVSASDPLDSDSFRRFAINVPADAALTKVELLDTPQAYAGLGAQPAVLAQRTLP